MTATVLIVDDDPVQRRLLEAAVIKFGYTPATAGDGDAAIDALGSGSSSPIRLVILDLMMPGKSGMDVLNWIRENDIQVPVVVQTAQGSMDTAVAAMRAGAFDFVVKPIAPERLRVTIENALKVREREGTARKVRKSAGNDVLTFDEIVTESPAMERVLRLGRKAAASGIPILIEGESGVGKELVARAIRGDSERSGKPFVTVNCGAIPDNLVESILFGHEKGSFTGATDRHVGKFVEADGGTLFLDEVGDLPLDAQVKLLRAVQEGEVDPVGGKKSVKVDIRLISATHRDLIQRVKDGDFREDLYYRLNVFPIMVPPLRDRRDDIPLLVHHFIERHAKSGENLQVSGVTNDALAMLMAYDWPGNIRQLENAVFRAVVLADGPQLTENEFPQIRAQVEGIDAHATPITTENSGLSVDEALEMLENASSNGQLNKSDIQAFKEAPRGFINSLDTNGDMRKLEEVELDIIRFAIELYDGQMSEVARRLGIGRSTLYRKMRDHGIDPEEQRGRKLAG